MTLVEQIADQHYRAWRNTPPGRVQWEVSSVYLETLHLPEVYDYPITPQGLLDHETGIPIRSFMERETPLGKVEFDAFQKIEYWAMENALKDQINLTAIWISPPHSLRSADTKIIFNQLLGSPSGPTMRNYCLLFEGNPYFAIDIANKILQGVGSMREPFIDTETLRATPLLFQKQINLQDIYETILREVVSSGLVALKEGQEEIINQEAHAWARDYISSRFEKTNVRVKEVVATHSVSCPPEPTASEYLIIHGEVCKFVKNCGSCGVTIDSFIPKGYRCKSCYGVYRGC